ncbi:MAG: cytochrome c oxidase subunit 3 [Gemmatimonadota bacterium]|nr:cytochrome c oxidase subunit 3 [Gemmatimonadota bacterium]
MFYIINGFHGFHVLAGVVYLLVIVSLNGRYTAQNHDGVTMAGLYWHFVDLLWVLIFSTLYIF